MEIVATDWMREVFEPTVRMIPAEFRSQIQPAQFFHEVLDHRWFMAERVGHDVSMQDAVTSYIKNVLPQYKMDKRVLAAINADADSGVVDDEYTYSTSSPMTRDIDEDDQDASVWAS